MPNSSSVQDDLKALSQGLLGSAGTTVMSGDVLEVRHVAAPVLNAGLLHHTGRGFSQVLSLNQGREPGPGQQVVCDTASLPFPDGVFHKVLLHHVISGGMEKELAEAIRVLARDGILLIMGLNRLGWRFRSQGRLRRLPGIAPLKVKSQLVRLDMAMQGFAGAGLLGMKRPKLMSSGVSGLGSPVADLVLLQARHRDEAEMTPLSRSGVVQSASL